MGRSRYLTLADHAHEIVTTPTGAYCLRCQNEYGAQKELLARCGYATAVCRLFAQLVGRTCKFTQFRGGASFFGTVVAWEYPNCCLLVRDVEWTGEDFVQREKWLRFGWCGAIDDETEIVVLDTPAEQEE